jgi:hypothetical protein
MVGVQRVAAGQELQEVLAPGIRVGKGDPAGASVLTEEVDGAPVGQERDRETGDPAEDLLGVEGRRQDRAGLGQKPQALLDCPVLDGPGLRALDAWLHLLVRIRSFHERAVSRIASASAAGLIGLVKCFWNPASRLRRMSSSMP